MGFRGVGAMIPKSTTLEPASTGFPWAGYQDAARQHRIQPQGACTALFSLVLSGEWGNGSL